LFWRWQPERWKLSAEALCEFAITGINQYDPDTWTCVSTSSGSSTYRPLVFAGGSSSISGNDRREEPYL
jgi:hypothetical protein